MDQVLKVNAVIGALTTLLGYSSENPVRETLATIQDVDCVSFDDAVQLLLAEWYAEKNDLTLI